MESNYRENTKTKNITPPPPPDQCYLLHIQTIAKYIFHRSRPEMSALLSKYVHFSPSHFSTVCHESMYMTILQTAPVFLPMYPSAILMTARIFPYLTTCLLYVCRFFCFSLYKLSPRRVCVRPRQFSFFVFIISLFYRHDGQCCC